jgi:hypothetical protein
MKLDALNPYGIGRSLICRKTAAAAENLVVIIGPGEGVVVQGN